MNRKRIILLVVTLVVIMYAMWSVVGVVSAFAIGKSFSDLEKKVMDSWRADYTCLQGTSDHVLQGDGDTLRIGVETEDGALTVRVETLDGSTLYSREFTSDGYVTVDVPECVKVSVKADAHEGRFDICYLDNQNESFIMQEEPGGETPGFFV